MQQVQIGPRGDRNVINRRRGLFFSVPSKDGESSVKINGKMQMVLWVAGLRGAMSFALVENIPLYDAVTREGSKVKSELKAMTSATIVFTVFFLGGYTYYLMQHLGMMPNDNDSSPKGNTKSVNHISRSSSNKNIQNGRNKNGSTNNAIAVDGVILNNNSKFRHRGKNKI
eukprot:CAMPEP_0194156550 /NCGR_PEP_ID=MMETSP0152-20130528/68749_1 /TAXON_ID=1049557 /ORGANISM="Thalassiothrix antarctica, Strain L6-D1" /LENGTH=169 /DNA_ID=CAMNT_0038864301 /DNA_START=486 /DNA_END=995 /DNA_ORIENTATION=+